jgi:hypothetical protein
VRPARPHHASPIDARPADVAALALGLPSPPGMTHPSFPTPQHDRDARAIRVDEPSAGGRITGPMVGCPVDRGAIDGRSLLGALDPAAVADPYPRYARLRA